MLFKGTSKHVRDKFCFNTGIPHCHLVLGCCLTSSSCEFIWKGESYSHPQGIIFPLVAGMAAVQASARPHRGSANRGLTLRVEFVHGPSKDQHSSVAVIGYWREHVWRGKTASLVGHSFLSSPPTQIVARGKRSILIFFLYSLLFSLLLMIVMKSQEIQLERHSQGNIQCLF